MQKDVYMRLVCFHHLLMNNLVPPSTTLPIFNYSSTFSSSTFNSSTFNCSSRLQLFHS